MSQDNLPPVDMLKISGPKLFICEVQGSDSEGSGSEKMPFKTLLKAVEFAKGSANHTFLVRKVVSENYAIAAKAAMKKVANKYEENLRKAEKARERSAKDTAEAAKQAEATQKRLEESRSIVVTEDASLPAAKKVLLEN